MNNTLIFTDIYSDELIKKLPSLNIKDAIFLTQNEKTFLQLQGMSYHVYFVQEILTSEDIKTTDQLCLDFIRSVFFPADKNIFQYAGYPFGYITEFYLIRYFMRLFRDILCTVKIINHFHHDEIIVVGTDRFAEMVSTVLHQKGISFTSLLNSRTNKAAYLLKRFAYGKKNLWAGTPFRELLVELVQNLVIIGESYWVKLYSKLKKRRGCSTRQKKCLIFSADRYTYEIYNALKKNADWDFLTCGLYYRFRKTLLKEVASFEGGFRLRMLAKTAKAFIHFLLTWSRLRKDAAFKRKFEFSGINYWGSISKLMKYTMLISFPRLFLDHLIAVEVFSSHPKSVCIVSDDRVPYYKTLVYAARQCGVKSVVIQHGILAGINGTNTINADFYAAWGPRAIEWFSTNWDSKSAEKIFVTGSPRYDAYAAPKDFDKGKIAQDLKLPQDKKIILVLPAWSGDFSVFSTNMRDLSMIDAILTALSRLGIDEKCHIIIKPHPGGDKELLEQFFKSKKHLPANSTIIEGHLEELFFITDICVSAYSSCILEAMFFEKPSIVFDNLSIREAVPYVSRGAALGASNAEEMAISIETLLFDPEATKKIIDTQKEYIEYEAYRLDGKATERVVALLEKIISGEKITQVH